MSRLIVKWRYSKPGAVKHLNNLVKYIATRDGVEKCDESWKLYPPTREQARLIARFEKDLPESVESYEYKDYKNNPTKYTASRFISRAIDDNLELIDKLENYVGYIAQRPHVEKSGTHGLFSSEDKPIVLDRVAKEVSSHNGIVWTTIISLRREDAEHLGFDKAKAWRNLLRENIVALSKAMNVPIKDLKWYAAFHNEGHHPHIHLISYSTGKEPYMNEQGLEKLKAALSRDIFKSERYNIYEKQTKARTDLREYGAALIKKTIAEIQRGGYSNPKVEMLLSELTDRLKDYSGKRVYGFLPESTKNIIDGIVDELSKDERIERLYDLWYKQKEELYRMYQDNLPERIPLAANDEFKSIRNAVLKEAFNILNDVDTVDDIELEEEPDTEFTDEDLESENKSSKSLRWELYRKGKEYLNKDSEDYNPQLAADKFAESANLGCDVAKYQLGKLFYSGEHIPRDIEQALMWFEESAEEGNQFSEYKLGKILLFGEDAPQDIRRAEVLLKRSANKGNKYAKYTLGTEYLSGKTLNQDTETALRYLRESADSGFTAAAFVYGRILYNGELTEKNVQRAIRYLEKAITSNDSSSAYLLGKIYLTEEACKNTDKAIKYFEMSAKLGNDYAMFQLGKLYLFGREVPQDTEKAKEYLQMSAKSGNKYAENLLNNMAENRNVYLGLGATRLLKYLSQILRNNIEDDKRGRVGLIDRKQQKAINEKKQAQGIRIE